MMHSDMDAAIRIVDAAIGDGYLTGAELETFSNVRSKVSFVAVDEHESVVGVGTGAIVSGIEHVAPSDQHQSTLRLLPEIAGGPVGILKTGAVAPEARQLGLGGRLVAAMTAALRGMGTTTIVALGWTDADGCYIEPTLTRLGFEVRGDIRGYWTADSIAHGYGCPTCGSPCLCTARLFALA
jgi:predicted N-acetyltransferase YhbS